MLASDTVAAWLGGGIMHKVQLHAVLLFIGICNQTQEDMVRHLRK